MMHAPGNDEQQPRRQPSACAVQPPANPRRQLLRLGTGEQVAEIERVEEILLGHPAPLLHQLAVHQRDLPGRSAEREEPDAGEGSEKFGERGGGGGHIRARCSSRYVQFGPTCL